MSKATNNANAPFAGNDGDIHTIFASIRSNKTGADNLSARLLFSLYSSYENTWDADVLKAFFGTEDGSVRRAKMDSFLCECDKEFSLEVRRLDAEKEKERKDKNTSYIADITNKHAYLRIQLTEALTALYALRVGFTAKSMDIVPTRVKMKANNRFIVLYKDEEGIETPFDNDMTARAIRMLGSSALKSIKPNKHKVTAAKSGDSVTGKSAKQAITSMAETFERNVNALVKAQAEANNGGMANVTDLDDDTYKAVNKVTIDAIKAQFTDDEGYVDLMSLEDWLTEQGIKFRYGNKPAKKSA